MADINGKNFVKSIANNFELIEPILEIGSLQVDNNEELEDLRPLFKNKQYIGCDIRGGKGVDIIMDAENLEFPEASIGTVIMLYTLEHVQNPFRVINEAYRVLKPNGTVIIAVPMNAAVHNFPSDYWRFTPEAVKLLLNEFPVKYIGAIGDPDFPNAVLAVGIKSPNTDYNYTFDNLDFKPVPKQSQFEKIKSILYYTRSLKMLERYECITHK